MQRSLDTRQRLPERELSDPQIAAIRYLEHGYPCWRVRWHYHDEYELHLITATRGKMFVGDYVGNFGPGKLILTGPRLPHNWVSLIGPEENYPLRDRLIHFEHDTLVGAAALLPELRGLLPMMERARRGIEFNGMSGEVEKSLVAIKESDGMARMGHFCELMDRLAHCQDYRLLSTAQINLPTQESLQEKIDQAVNYMMAHSRSRITLAQVAELVGMSESYFSRFFHKATGNRFSDFLNRIRISRACDLLSRTDRQVTTICYEVGFNNIANFNRRFRQYKQLTPGEYRKLTQQRYLDQIGSNG